MSPVCLLLLCSDWHTLEYFRPRVNHQSAAPAPGTVETERIEWAQSGFGGRGRNERQNPTTTLSPGGLSPEEMSEYESNSALGASSVVWQLTDRQLAQMVGLCFGPVIATPAIAASYERRVPQRQESVPRMSGCRCCVRTARKDLVVQHVRRGIGQRPILALVPHKEFVIAVDAHGDDDARPKGPGSVGL